MSWSSTLDHSNSKICKLWEEKFIQPRATSIKRAMFGCRYIIEVDWQKIIHKEYHEKYNGRLWDWSLRPEFREQFIYPNCKLKDHVFIVEMRGLYDSVGDEIFIDNALGIDACFLGTNNEKIATMLRLKYS